MKPRVPLALTVIIGLIILALGWQNHRQISQLRDNQTQLLQQARSLNLDLDKPIPLSTRPHQREESIDLDQIARDFITCGVEFEDCYNDYDLKMLGQASRDRIVAAIEGVISLNQFQLKQLLEIISRQPNLGENVRRDLLSFVLSQWDTINPKATFDFLSASDILREQLGTSYLRLINSALTSWITEAPDEVLQWLRQSRDTLPKEIRESATSTFSREIALSRPLETFDIISEFSDQPHSYFPHILRSSTLTVSDRVQALTRIQQMAAEISDSSKEKDFLVENFEVLVLSSESHEADFQTSINTIKDANLSVDDIEFIWNPSINDLGYHIKEEQTSDWILWLRDNIPAEKSTRRINQLLENWQRRDPKSATDFAKKHDLVE